jgi:hypothetical protein
MKVISPRLVGAFRAGPDRFDARWQKFFPQRKYREDKGVVSNGNRQLLPFCLCFFELLFMSMHSRTNTAINKTNQNKNNSILNLRNSSILNSLSNNTLNNRSMPNNSNILNNKNSCVLNNSSNSSNMPNSTRLSHALKSSSVWCRAAGSSTAPKTGSQTTAPGNNVAATVVIASLTTDTVDRYDTDDVDVSYVDNGD